MLASIRKKLDPRAYDNNYFAWVLKTATTATLGLALATIGFLNNATYYV